MKLVVFSSAEAAYEPRLFYKVARSAAAAGYEVVIIAQYLGRTVRENIRIEGLSVPRNRLERMICTTWKAFFRALREKGDVYHFSDPELIPLGLLLQSLVRRPVVYDLREYHAERIRNKFWLPRQIRGIVAFLYEWVENTFLRHFAGVVTVNEHLASRLRAQGCRVAVVPNYPPLSVFSAETTDDNLKNQYERNRLIVHVGGMSEDRGIIQAVRAVAIVRERVPTAKLLLLGPFHQSEFEQEVRDLVAKLSLDEAVDFLGVVPHSQVQSYLRLVEIGLILLQPIRRHEQAEPIKYFEYAAMAVPEVVSDLPALRRLIKKNENGILVDPTDERAIADAIVQLLQNRELASAMGARGRRAILEEYNWNVSFARLRGLYEAVVSR